MLCVPEFRYFPDYRVTAYIDDTIWWKFYLIPDYVSIRRDKNNNPVFLLIKYAFSDQDRERNPELAEGGGYMAFDVELSVPEADYAAIMAELQRYVNEEWQRRKTAAENAGKNVQGYRLSTWNYVGFKSLSVSDLKLGLGNDSPGVPPGDRPPKVLIANPTWKDGTFKVYAPQTAQLISNRVAEGPASLVGNNVAAANLDLTQQGATFMERTLTETTGEGATDLTPLQVMYNLTMLARVPPVTMSIRADVRNLYMSLKEIYHDYDEHGCSENDMTHIDTYMQMAVQSGLIDIKIDTGLLDLKEDFVQELQQFATETAQKMIENAFFDKKEKKDDDDKKEDDTSGFLGSHEDIYYLKTEVDFSAISFEQRLELRGAMDWKVNPQGMMQTFFAGMSKADIKKFVRVVDLDDDFFKTLQLKVRAFADWENEPIDFIECQIRYEGRDENDQQVEKVQTFTFTKDSTVGEWDPSLIKSKREYSYRWRVGFKGREPGDFTRWEKDRTPNLNLSVADPGKIAINVLAGSIDFAQITNQVQVEISYKDPGSNVDEESTTLVLADGLQSQQYQRYIYTDWDRPVRYRTIFFLKDGQRIEGPWEETTSRQLLINEPFVDKLDVQLVPAGQWSGVVQTVISLRYEDKPNQYATDAAFSIKKVEEFKTWQVVLRDVRNRKFQYKVLTTFLDGTFKETNWINADSDQAIPIVVQQTPYLKVKVLPNLLDFKATPVVECTLRYDDDTAGIHEVETFTLTSGEPSEWSIPIANATRNKYRQQLTYHISDGRKIVPPEVTTDVTSLVIAKPEMPEIVCTMMPKLINFSETPLVEVTLTYQDSKHNIDVNETLIFSDQTSQTIRIPIHEDSPKDYDVTVLYYLANGSPVPAEPKPMTLNKKQLILPRYVAQ